jgi:uncharacterized LabA/DUF88 family protein
MSEFVYVDNSNVYIEGKRVSAVKRGLALSLEDSFTYKILDNDHRMDFGRLHDLIAGNDPKQIKRAVLFGSRPPKNDSLWDVARRCGFETVLEDRNLSNKEKRIDTGIVTMMMKDAYTKADKKKDILTLVAGDGDYIPTFNALIEDGFTVEVAFWGHASAALRKVASKFFNLNSYLEHLRFKEE